MRYYNNCMVIWKGAGLYIRNALAWEKVKYLWAVEELLNDGTVSADCFAILTLNNTIEGLS